MIPDLALLFAYRNVSLALATANSPPAQVSWTSGSRAHVTGYEKSALVCHSERSEESLFNLAIKERFFASLRMTNVELFRSLFRQNEFLRTVDRWCSITRDDHRYSGSER